MANSTFACYVNFVDPKYGVVDDGFFVQDSQHGYAYFTEGEVQYTGGATRGQFSVTAVSGYVPLVDSGGDTNCYWSGLVPVPSPQGAQSCRIQASSSQPPILTLLVACDPSQPSGTLTINFGTSACSAILPDAVPPGWIAFEDISLDNNYSVVLTPAAQITTDMALVFLQVYCPTLTSIDVTINSSPGVFLQCAAAALGTAAPAPVVPPAPVVSPLALQTSLAPTKAAVTVQAGTLFLESAAFQYGYNPDGPGVNYFSEVSFANVTSMYTMWDLVAPAFPGSPPSGPCPGIGAFTIDLGDGYDFSADWPLTLLFARGPPSSASYPVTSPTTFTLQFNGNKVQYGAVLPGSAMQGVSTSDLSLVLELNQELQYSLMANTTAAMEGVVAVTVSSILSTQIQTIAVTVDTPSSDYTPMYVLQAVAFGPVEFPAPVSSVLLDVVTTTTVRNKRSRAVVKETSVASTVCVGLGDPEWTVTHTPSAACQVPRGRYLVTTTTRVHSRDPGFVAVSGSGPPLGELTITTMPKW